jgi:hypothetical protein
MSQESILRPSECEKTPSAATNGDADGVDTGPPELAPAIVTSVTVDRNIRGGPALLDAHRAGARLTQRQGILAKCADCMGRYVDGRVDCRVPACPLYPWMPYREDG